MMIDENMFGWCVIFENTLLFGECKHLSKFVFALVFFSPTKTSLLNCQKQKKTKENFKIKAHKRCSKKKSMKIKFFFYFYTFNLIIQINKTIMETVVAVVVMMMMKDVPFYKLQPVSS